tara:strand:- start:323 stop:427 length:105 start_codon:yes stop_codon:yes gene_type:complete
MRDWMVGSNLLSTFCCDKATEKQMIMIKKIIFFL